MSSVRNVLAGFLLISLVVHSAATAQSGGRKNPSPPKQEAAAPTNQESTKSQAAGARRRMAAEAEPKAQTSSSNIAAARLAQPTLAENRASSPSPRLQPGLLPSTAQPAANSGTSKSTTSSLPAPHSKTDRGASQDNSSSANRTSVGQNHAAQASDTSARNQKSNKSKRDRQQDDDAAEREADLRAWGAQFSIPDEKVQQLIDEVNRRKDDPLLPMWLREAKLKMVREGLSLPESATGNPVDVINDVAKAQLVGAGEAAQSEEFWKARQKHGVGAALTDELIKNGTIPEGVIDTTDKLKNGERPGASLGELLGAKGDLELIGADSNDPGAWGAIRDVESMRGLDRVQGIQDLMEQYGNGAGTKSGNAPTSGGSDTSGGNPNRDGSDSNTSSGNNSNGTDDRFIGGGSSTSDPGHSNGSTTTGGNGSGSSASGGQQSSATDPTSGNGSANDQPSDTQNGPPAAGASDSDSSDDSSDDSSSGYPPGYTAVVTHNDDGSYNVDVYYTHDDGTTEHTGSEHYSDSDGDGNYEGSEGGTSNGVPPEGSYQPTENESGDLQYTFPKSDDSSDESDQDDGDSGEDEASTETTENGVDYTPSDPDNPGRRRSQEETQSLIDQWRQRVGGAGTNPNGTPNSTPTEDQAGSGGHVLVGDRFGKPKGPKGKDMIMLPVEDQRTMPPRESLPPPGTNPNGDVINPERGS